MAGYKVINTRLLEMYKRIYGDLRIPQTFVVPASGFNWPKYFQGFTLGLYANTMRKQRIEDVSVFDPAELEATKEMGFVWKVAPPETELVLFAFKLYTRRYPVSRTGDIPLTFKVPDNDSFWPEVTHGMKLGETLFNIRLHKIHKPIHSELKKLGLDINIRPEITEFDRIYDALVAYKSIHGHLSVQRTFIVPCDDSRFPEHTHGVHIGYAVHSIQHKGHFSQHIPKLRELGLKVPDTSDENSQFAVILSALTVYKQLHSDLAVPHTFVVSQGSAEYPKEAWGLKLGAIVKSIRKNNIYANYRNQLTEIGFEFPVNNNTDNKTGNSPRNHSKNSNRRFKQNPRIHPVPIPVKHADNREIVETVRD